MYRHKQITREIETLYIHFILKGLRRNKQQEKIHLEISTEVIFLREKKKKWEQFTCLIILEKLASLSIALINH